LGQTPLDKRKNPHKGLRDEKIGYILNSFPELRIKPQQGKTDRFHPRVPKAPDGAKTDQIKFHNGKCLVKLEQEKS